MQEQNFLLGPDRADPALEGKEKDICYFLAWALRRLALRPVKLDMLLSGLFQLLVEIKGNISLGAKNQPFFNSQ